MTARALRLLPAFVLVLHASAALAQAPGAWVGTWEGDGVKLELRASGAGLEGTVEVGGARYPATLEPTPAGLAGTFEAAGARHALTLAREGLDVDGARLESGGVTRRLRRAGGRAAPAAPGAQAVAAPAGPWTWESVAAPEGCSASRVKLSTQALAPALLAGALDELGRTFGARPRPVSAFADAEGREGHALFEGAQGGAAVRGVIVVRAGAEASVQVAWTSAARFAEAFPALQQALGGQTTAAAPPVQWLPVLQFPDGSGQVRVPAGWTVTFASKGALDANGPHGWASFGAARTVFTPQGAAGLFVRPPLVADYTDPVRAFQEMIPQDNAYAQQTGGWQTLEWSLIEQSPTDYPNGQAAFLHGEGTIAHPDGRRMRIRNLTLVVMAPIDGSQWMYYISQVGSPAEQWATSLPVLFELWSTWKISDQEVRGRLQKAAETMREITKIRQGVIDERNAFHADQRSAWGHVIRGDWPIEDTANGARADVDQDVLKPSLEALNEAAGYERYREVPLRDLVD